MKKMDKLYNIKNNSMNESTDQHKAYKVTTRYMKQHDMFPALDK